MAITIRDVAEAAGVSVATVSRVANGSTNDYPVRPQTRERVLEAIVRLGYRPNDNARRLLQKRSGLIGILVPDISNPYYPEVARGIEDVASANGFTVMFCSTDRLPEKAASYIEALLLKRVDGLVVVGGGDEIQLSESSVATYGTKVVFIGRPSKAFSTVRIDNIGAARDATEHLLGLGHTRIGFIAAGTSSTTVTERRRGYVQAIEAAGGAVDEDLIVDGDFSEAVGHAAALRLLRLPDPPTAIFAANDRMALGAMAAVADLGLAVPGDVALVGFDDVPMSAFLRPSLTTVSVAAQELGVRAMEALVKDINGDGRPGRRRIRVATRLVVRDSCGASARQARGRASEASPAV
ncbi:substrate-binding domain-containing protein [Microbacterium sp. SYP-A9085]|uniref:LacI family DNA-binding transcriptional regulator n=1 Tax=Microbacterium sp. SYP-A9085 TaxID=2664454 RepID=UPI00129BBA04|nr:LacI family DNA-binding transcriptional regulator [Microbacterium sp. SYP-A9085]MRH27956.1 substrate-binding domain-containing protein [Microbacterium sp. SYP-A9085]